MENIIPSDNRLNEEVITMMLKEGDVAYLLVEKSQLTKRMKEIDDLVKERRKLIHEKMVELNVKQLELDEGYYIVNILPTSRAKMMSVSVLRKTYPQLVEKLVTEVDVSGYIAIKRR